MKLVQHAVSAQQPVPVIALAAASVESAVEAGDTAKPLAEILVYSYALPLWSPSLGGF